MTDVAIVGNVYPRVFFGHCHLSCQAREREAGSEVVFFRTPPRDVAPIREGAIAGSTTILCVRLLWIGNVEEVGDLILNRQKSLCLPGCEPLYDPFPSSCQLVRILRAIVHPFVLAVFDDEPHLCPRGAVGTELVRDHHARRRHG